MTYLPANATVWTEIPVNDLDKAMEFYAATTGMGFNKVTDMGPNPFSMFNNENPQDGIAGHLYPGKPAGDGSGPTIHLGLLGSAQRTSRVQKADP